MATEILDGVDDHEMMSKVPFITEGDYRVSFQSMRQGAEFKSKKQILDTVVKVIKGAGEKAMKPGDAALLRIKERKFNYHLNDVKNLGAAILNEPPTSVTKAVLQELLKTDSPAKDVEFDVKVTRVGDDERGYSTFEFKPVTATGKKQKAA